MRVVFMGTPVFAVPALAALMASVHEVVAVYSQPPRPAGRGMKLTPSPVQALAERHGVPMFTPSSLKNSEAQDQFALHGADIAVVAAYGLLLPQPILDAPKFGCINIHPSALPRWRGAAPIQRSLMAGDTQTECCIIRLELGLDTGPVLMRQAYSIPPDMDAGELQEAMATLGAQQVLTVLQGLAEGTIDAKPQANDGITYAGKITKADRLLDWSRPAAALLHQIRGLSPAPAALLELPGEPVKLFKAELAAGDISKPVGTTLDDALRINAGGGTALRLSELQRAGKSRQSATQFLQGFPVPAGTYAKNPI